MAVLAIVVYLPPYTNCNWRSFTKRFIMFSGSWPEWFITIALLIRQNAYPTKSVFRQPLKKVDLTSTTTQSRYWSPTGPCQIISLFPWCLYTNHGSHTISSFCHVGTLWLCHQLTMLLGGYVWDQSNYICFRGEEERSISPLMPLRKKWIYVPLHLFGLPFSFKNEVATEFETKTGTLFKPD